MAIIEEQLQDVRQQRTEHGETLEHLSGNENYEKKTILSTYEQAYAFGTLSTIAEENNIVFLKKWLKNIADWNLSVSGKGRNDIVEVSKFKGQQQASWNERFLEAIGRER
jgi:hypothetical protein